MNPRQILVVDDEWGIGEAIVFLLMRDGYQARYAPNGLVALEMLAREPVDMVLTDLMMPIVDGSELLRKMRTMDDLASMPVVVMSAVPENIARTACPLATAFLRKPFPSALLLDEVRKILG